MQNPIETELVLLGGGHSHAIVLKQWGMNPMPGVRLTLINDVSHTPYSGMLPGHVAGIYDFDQTHIDLRYLTRYAQAQFYLDHAIGLDLTQRQIICQNRPPVAFDLLSIDIGSTPAIASVPGANKYAIPAKPVPQFLNAWEKIVQQTTENSQGAIKLAIIGGGAGGVELALNMQARLTGIFASVGQKAGNFSLHLYHRGERLLPQHNLWVSRRLQTLLSQRGVTLHLATNVLEIKNSTVITDSSITADFDAIFWVTQATAPAWIKQSGLKTDQQGFVWVKETLQSVSHPWVFAAGDIATMQQYSRPKAGVFAVRQGKPLLGNLQRFIKQKPLHSYRPQRQYLGLIGTGDQEAIASWSQFGWQAPWLWRWKDHIDRKFMDQFRDLSPMPSKPNADKMRSSLNPPHQSAEVRQSTTMRCAGCGSKIPNSILARTLQRFTQSPEANILIGLDAPDDAAVVQLPPDTVMVQTLDFFRSLLDDPFIFAQIVANHCLNDLFAMNAIPQTAMAMVTIPYGSLAIVEETLYQLLSGALQVLGESATQLVGGHTTEGAELAFGLSCQGFSQPEKIWRKSGLMPGQALILTKPIGTGALFAADMHLQAKGRWIDSAIAAMLCSNQKAVDIFQQYGATACTDISGFGLLGHLSEMVKASKISVQLNLEAIPVLEGAIASVEKGIVSTLQPQNLNFANIIENLSDISPSSRYSLLFDPQTSGGLLASIPMSNARHCLEKLQALAYHESQIIGNVLTRKTSNKILIV